MPLTAHATEGTLGSLASLSDLFPAVLAAGAGDGTVPIAILIIIVLGVGAQWLAWRIKLPSIILLLLFGMAVGPIWSLASGKPPLLDPDSIIGNQGLLFSLVGISVGLILYEGGLTLRFKELAGAKRVVINLVSIGALVTGVLASLAGRYVMGLSWEMAVLIGCILIVTGPTVVGPLLGHIRPAGAVGPVLKWEGIVIDPVGASAAVLALEVVLIGTLGDATGAVAEALIKTVVAGGLLGFAGAALLVLSMQRFWIPEALQNPVSLMVVVVVFLASDAIQAESGLLATTVMGIVLANQNRVDIHHILEFKENLRVLLISALFIILAARITPDALRQLDLLRAAFFLVALIVVVRPASVFLSTIGQGLTIRERLFLCWMAPRGIVAAAVASVFAIAIEAAIAERGAEGLPDPTPLVPVMFAVIVGTVLFYGLTAPIAARVLGISDSNPQGVIVVGASRAARAIAAVLSARKIRVIMLDVNRSNVTAARFAGLEARFGNVLDDLFYEGLDLRGIGRAIALTPNDEVNTLALQKFGRRFGKAEIYRLPARPPRTPAGQAKTERSSSAGTPIPPTASAPATAPAAAQNDGAADIGRRLFDHRTDLATIEERLDAGWVFKATTISEEFTLDHFRQLYGPGVLVLATIDPAKGLDFAVPGKDVSAKPGVTMIALINPEELLFGQPLREPSTTATAPTA